MGIDVFDESNSEFVFINKKGTVLLEKNDDYKKLENELKKIEYQEMMTDILAKAR